MCIIRQLHLFMQMGCWLGLSKNSRSSSGGWLLRMQRPDHHQQSPRERAKALSY